MRRSSKTKRIIPFKVKEISAMEKREKVVLEKTQKEQILLSKNIKELELKEISLGNSIVRKQSTLDDMNVDKADKELELKELNKNIGKKLKDYLAVEEEIEKLGYNYLEDKAELERELEDGRKYHREEMEGMDIKLKEIKDDVNDLYATKDSLEVQIMASNVELEQNECKFDELNGHIDLANEMIEDKEKYIVELNKDSSNINEDIKSKSILLNELTKELDGLAKEIEIKNNINDKLKKENKSLNTSKLTFYKRQKDVEEKAEIVKRYYKGANVEIEL